MLCAVGCRVPRPFDPAQATNETGAWFWVGVPKSILINGKGQYSDCEDVYKRRVNQAMANGKAAAAADLLSPPGVAGQLGPTAAWPVCNVTSAGNTAPGEL